MQKRLTYIAYISHKISVPPHFSVGKAGEIFRFLELPCEVALIIEAAEVRDFLNGLVRESQELLAIIYA